MKRNPTTIVEVLAFLTLAASVALSPLRAAEPPGPGAKDQPPGPIGQMKPLDIQATQLTQTMLEQAGKAQTANVAANAAKTQLDEQKLKVRKLEDDLPPPSATPAERTARAARIAEAKKPLPQLEKAVTDKTLEATRLQKEFLSTKATHEKFVREHPDVKPVDLASVWQKLQPHGITLDKNTALDQAKALLKDASGWDGNSVPVVSGPLLPGPGRPHDPLPTTRMLDQAALEAAWAKLEGARTAIDAHAQRLQREQKELNDLAETLAREERELATHQKTALMPEYQGLQKELGELTAADGKLVSEQKALAARFADLKRRIEYHNAHPPDPNDPAAVARYNEEARGQNVEGERLKSEERDLNTLINAHLGRFADYKTREKDYNARSEAFNRQLYALRDKFTAKNRQASELSAKWTAHQVTKVEFERGSADYQKRADEFKKKWGEAPDKR